MFLSVADMRGFMTSHGQPDQSRSARYILKDYVSVSHIKWREGSSCCSDLSVPGMLGETSHQMCFSCFYNCDSLQGKLLYCHPPPHIDDEDFQPQHKMFLSRKFDSSDLSAAVSKQKIKRIENTVDKSFFHQVQNISYFLITHCDMQ